MWLAAACLCALPADAARSKSKPRAAAAAATREYAVIVSPDVEVTDLSVAELRRVFLLERRFWKTGQPLVVILPPGGTRTREFLLGKVCGIDETEFRKMVLEKMYRGELDLAPKVVGSNGEAVSFVSTSRGLVALIPAQRPDPEGVRVLRVEGKAAGSSGYRLKD